MKTFVCFFSFLDNGQNSSANTSYTGSLGSTTDKIRMVRKNQMLSTSLESFTCDTRIANILLATNYYNAPIYPMASRSAIKIILICQVLETLHTFSHMMLYGMELVDFVRNKN